MNTVVSNPAVEENKNRVAIQYGPLVYCLEGDGKQVMANNVILPENTSFNVQFDAKLLGGVNTIQFEAPAIIISIEGAGLSTKTEQLTAIPYYSWNNRGNRDMQVWFPVTIERILINKQ